MVRVASAAAWAGKAEDATITSTLAFTSSAARAGRRSKRPSDERHSITRLRPSTKPCFLSPSRNSSNSALSETSKALARMPSRYVRPAVWASALRARRSSNPIAIQEVGAVRRITRALLLVGARSVAREGGKGKRYRGLAAELVQQFPRVIRPGELGVRLQGASEPGRGIGLAPELMVGQAEVILDHRVLRRELRRL